MLIDRKCLSVRICVFRFLPLFFYIFYIHCGIRIKRLSICCYQSQSTVIGGLKCSSAHPSRLLAGAAPFRYALTKEIIMKYFGTVKSFDLSTGHGEIKQEAGGNDLRFEKSAIAWDKNIHPTVGQRLSYDVGTSTDRQPCALNLQTI